MKQSIVKIVALSALCASFVGVSAIASAHGPRDREIRAKISRLQERKDRAIAHHDRRRAHEIQEQINGLRAQLHHH